MYEIMVVWVVDLGIEGLIVIMLLVGFIVMFMNLFILLVCFVDWYSVVMILLFMVFMVFIVLVLK